jgi:hypothetical protein
MPGRKFEIFQGPPRYTDGSPMAVDRECVPDAKRLRDALEEIVKLPDDQIYVRARGIALRALLNI